MDVIDLTTEEDDDDEEQGVKFKRNEKKKAEMLSFVALKPIGTDDSIDVVDLLDEENYSYNQMLLQINHVPFPPLFRELHCDGNKAFSNPNHSLVENPHPNKVVQTTRQHRRSSYQSKPSIHQVIDISLDESDDGHLSIGDKRCRDSFETVSKKSINHMTSNDNKSNLEGNASTNDIMGSLPNSPLETLSKPCSIRSVSNTDPEEPLQPPFPVNPEPLHVSESHGIKQKRSHPQAYCSNSQRKCKQRHECNCNRPLYNKELERKPGKKTSIAIGESTTRQTTNAQAESKHARTANKATHHPSRPTKQSLDILPVVEEGKSIQGGYQRCTLDKVHPRGKQFKMRKTRKKSKMERMDTQKEHPHKKNKMSRCFTCDVAENNVKGSRFGGLHHDKSLAAQNTELRIDCLKSLRNKSKTISTPLIGVEPISCTTPAGSNQSPNFVLIDDDSDDESPQSLQSCQREDKTARAFSCHSELHPSEPISSPHVRPLEKKFCPGADFNFHKSIQEALDEQERLLRQAAASLHVHRAFLQSMRPAKHLQHWESPVFTHIIDPDQLDCNHWRWPCVYARLGLPRNANESCVKKQYRKHALRYHPDKCRWEDASLRFQAITEAYNKIRQRD